MTIHKYLRHNEATCTSDGPMILGDTPLMQQSVFMVKWCVGLAFLRLLGLNIHVSSVSPTQSRPFLHYAELLCVTGFDIVICTHVWFQIWNRRKLAMVSAVELMLLTMSAYGEGVLLCPQRIFSGLFTF